MELSQNEKYKNKVEALNCFKGINTLTAMTLVTEIGDIKRFPHPEKLTSYSGLDIREYSSGGKENKLGVTKIGNKRIRTVVIEACQRASTKTVLSKRLKIARAGKDLKVVDVAVKCTERLRKKSVRLFERGKHKNKIKTACAREMLGFIWESLNLVA